MERGFPEVSGSEPSCFLTLLLPTKMLFSSETGEQTAVDAGRVFS